MGDGSKGIGDGWIPEADSAMALEGHVACCDWLDEAEEGRPCLDVLSNPFRQARHDGLRRRHQKEPMDLDVNALCRR